MDRKIRLRLSSPLRFLPPRSSGQKDGRSTLRPYSFPLTLTLSLQG